MWPFLLQHLVVRQIDWVIFNLKLVLNLILMLIFALYFTFTYAILNLFGRIQMDFICAFYLAQLINLGVLYQSLLYMSSLSSALALLQRDVNIYTHSYNPTHPSTPTPTNPIPTHPNPINPTNPNYTTLPPLSTPAFIPPPTLGMGGDGEGGGGSRVGVGGMAWVEGYVFSISTLRSKLLFQFIKH